MLRLPASRPDHSRHLMKRLTVQGHSQAGLFKNSRPVTSCAMLRQKCCTRVPKCLLGWSAGHTQLIQALTGEFSPSFPEAAISGPHLVSALGICLVSVVLAQRPGSAHRPHSSQVCCRLRSLCSTFFWAAERLRICDGQCYKTIYAMTICRTETRAALAWAQPYQDRTSTLGSSHYSPTTWRSLL
ncbi:hypothetical protein BJX62DRAFT_60262 [Aspergillus germanicus]